MGSRAGAVSPGFGFGSTTPRWTESRRHIHARAHAVCTCARMWAIRVICSSGPTADGSIRPARSAARGSRPHTPNREMRSPHSASFASSARSGTRCFSFVAWRSTGIDPFGRASLRWPAPNASTSAGYRTEAIFRLASRRYVGSVRSRAAAMHMSGALGHPQVWPFGEQRAGPLVVDRWHGRVPPFSYACLACS